LTFLSRNIKELPVLLAVALREEEVQDPSLQDVLRGLRREGLSRDIALKGLEEDDARELLEHTIQAQLEPGRAHAAMRFLLEQTGGNPYFFIEVVHLWQEMGLIRVEEGRAVVDSRLSQRSGNVKLAVPESVTTLLTQRLNTLSGDERDVLEGASIQGQEFDVAPLEHLFQSQEKGVGRVLNKLSSKRGLITSKGEDRTRYGFSHVLLWETVRDSVPEERKKQWSEQLASWWEAHLPADIERIATLYQRGGLDEKALHCVDQVVAMSLEMHSHERVAKYFEMRLALMEREGATVTEMVEWGLSIVDRLIRDGGDIRWIEPMCRRLLKMDPPEPLSWELIVCLSFVIAVGRVREARQLLSKVIDATHQRPEVGSQKLLGRVAVANSRLLYYEGWLDDSAESARVGLSILPDDEQYFRGFAYWQLGWIGNDRSLWNDAVSNLEKGLALARSRRIWGLIPSFLNLKGAIASTRGELSVAEECFEEAASTCKDLGQVLTLSVFLINLSLTRMERGDIQGSEDASKSAMRVAEAFDLTYAKGAAAQTLGKALIMKKSPREAMSLFKRARQVFMETGNTEMLGDLDMDMAEAKGMLGDLSGAQSDLEKVKKEADLLPVALPRFHLLKARLCLEAGSAEDARKEMNMSLEESRRQGLRYDEGMVLLAISEWEKKNGSPEGASRAREEAERLLKECGVVDVALFS
jgi:tetratricopeptide (TPR) repeat protein